MFKIFGLPDGIPLLFALGLKNLLLGEVFGEFLRRQALRDERRLSPHRLMYVETIVP